MEEKDILSQQNMKDIVLMKDLCFQKILFIYYKLPKEKVDLIGSERLKFLDNMQDSGTVKNKIIQRKLLNFEKR